MERVAQPGAPWWRPGPHRPANGASRDHRSAVRQAVIDALTLSASRGPPTLQHLGGQSPAVADPVTVLLGPFPDRLQRLAVVARAAPTTFDSSVWAGRTATPPTELSS